MSSNRIISFFFFEEQEESTEMRSWVPLFPFIALLLLQQNFLIQAGWQRVAEKGNSTEVWYTLEMVVKEDQVGAFLDVFALVSNGTHTEPGVLQYDLLVNVSNQTHFNLVQRYVSAEAVQKHMTMPWVVKYMPLLISMLEKPYVQTNYKFEM